jgi:hypothetical protein
MSVIQLHPSMFVITFRVHSLSKIPRLSHSKDTLRQYQIFVPSTSKTVRGFPGYHDEKRCNVDAQEALVRERVRACYS